MTNIPGVCLATGVRTEIGFCVFSIRSGHTRLALQMVGKEAKIPINYTGGPGKSRKEILSKRKGGGREGAGSTMHGRSARLRINAAGVAVWRRAGKTDAL